MAADNARFRVRRANSCDWSAVRAVRLRALGDAPDAFGTTLAEEQGRTDAVWVRRLDNADVAHFLLTSADDVERGLVVGASWAGRPQSAGLFGMWVAPECRQQQAGWQLVQAVIGWARGSGFRDLLLDVADDNTPAIALYSACGFVPSGATGTLPPPRQHIMQHERRLELSSM